MLLLAMLDQTTNHAAYIAEIVYPTVPLLTHFPIASGEFGSECRVLDNKCRKELSYLEGAKTC